MQKLSIVVVTRNSAAFISECFQSIFGQHTSFSVEVIAVDNASTDGTAQLTENQFPRVHLIRNPENAGFNTANNQGIRKSSGDSILLLNPDTRLEPHALEEMLKFLRQHDDVAAVGPKILNGDGTLQRTGVSFPSLWNVFSESLFLDKMFPRSRIFGRHRRLHENPDASYAVDYVQGSCLMMKRGPIEEVGLLDEKFFMYFDEVDLCFRLKQRGWNIFYVPQALITHYGAGGATYYDEARLTSFYRSYMLFLKKHYSVFRRTMFRVLLVWRALIRVAVFSVSAMMVKPRQAEFLERSRAYRKAAMSLLKFS